MLFDFVHSATKALEPVKNLNTSRRGFLKYCALAVAAAAMPEVSKAADAPQLPPREQQTPHSTTRQNFVPFPIIPSNEYISVICGRTKAESSFSGYDENNQNNGFNGKCYFTLTGRGSTIAEIKISYDNGVLQTFMGETMAVKDGYGFAIRDENGNEIRQTLRMETRTAFPDGRILTDRGERGGICEYMQYEIAKRIASLGCPGDSPPPPPPQQYPLRGTDPYGRHGYNPNYIAPR